MRKDFKAWHQKKEKIDARKDMAEVFFREKEVWWCALGVNVGFEQDGKGAEFRRPILILKKFNQFAVLAVPLTTKLKPNNKYYVACDLKDGIARAVIVSQVRLVDTKRLIDKLGVLDEQSFTRTRNAVKAML
ncbi:MAG: type II toxin-antitoxin system PemK/MazF family toxin [Candidatus Vogelbacteria bacterium]|nr:type II toxin-antitoxin system PemK/MazF family toxin [Candidatus Vogelbacteria bacterium]